MSNIDNAFEFYSRCINDNYKIDLYKDRDMKIAGTVSSSDWELFASLITGRRGDGITGSDLLGWEVKSAKRGGSYEYQYHLNTGEEKLNDDCNVNHIFFSYSETYENVIVKAIKGSELAENFFLKWKPDYINNYDKSVPKSQRRQRFRKSIPFKYIEQHAITVLEIKEGVLIYKNDNIIASLNRDV